MTVEDASNTQQGMICMDSTQPLASWNLNKILPVIFQEIQLKFWPMSAQYIRCPYKSLYNTQECADCRLQPTDYDDGAGRVIQKYLRSEYKRELWLA